MALTNLDPHTPAYVCNHVFLRTKPTLYVCREDGDWQFLCGGYHKMDELPHVVGIGHLFDADPTLAPVAALQAGQEAERVSATDPWLIT